MSSASRGLAPDEGLVWLMLKQGHTRPSMEPRGGLQAGRAGYPHIQDADSSPRAQGALGLGFQAKPKGKCGAPRALTACGLDDAWRLVGRGHLQFPTPPRQLFPSDKRGAVCCHAFIASSSSCSKSPSPVAEELTRYADPPPNLLLNGR